MTQKERLEQLESAILAIKEEIIALEKIVINTGDRFFALQHEWRTYEDRYIKYLAKRDRFKNLLWWLFCKITFRSTKLSRKELTKRTAKKMARIFYKKGL